MEIKDFQILIENVIKYFCLFGIKLVGILLGVVDFEIF